jgi:hypothetical protein
MRANLRAGFNGSIRFAVDQNKDFRREGRAPYAMAGDQDGNYHPWTPSPGPHTVVAYPYKGKEPIGDYHLPVFSLSFTVADSR